MQIATIGSCVVGGWFCVIASDDCQRRTVALQGSSRSGVGETGFQRPGGTSGDLISARTGCGCHAKACRPLPTTNHGHQLGLVKMDNQIGAVSAGLTAGAAFGKTPSSSQQLLGVAHGASTWRSEEHLLIGAATNIN